MDYKINTTILRTTYLCFAIGMLFSTGCTALLTPINAIPAERVPIEFLAKPRANKIPTDLSRLRQPANDRYLLDSGDVLGVFIEGELGGKDEQPPIRLPEAGSDLPPAIGYPVPVREDGTISLPSFKNGLSLKGLTIGEAEKKIREEYQKLNIIPEAGTARIIVTLMKERTYRVIVVRQDNSSNQNRFQRSNRLIPEIQDYRSSGFVIDLPAYKNDVLHALAQTGGLPGLNAKNEVKILKKNSNQNDLQYQPGSPLSEDAKYTRIPLRHDPGSTPNFSPQDVILEDGDILYVDSRDTEVFYTGGLLGGGEFQLPRDYDLDVLAAMSVVGPGVAQTTRVSGGIGGNVAGMPPGELIILRKLPNNQQLPISVDLNYAMNHPEARLLIHPGDTLILRHRPREELMNFATSAFFTYGIRALLR